LLETKPELDDLGAISAQKNRALLIRLYHEIESRLDVNSMLVEGVHVWPLVRLQLGGAFKAADPIDDAGKVTGAPASVAGPAPQGASSLPRNKAARTAMLKSNRENARLDPATARARMEGDWARFEELAGPRFVVQTKIEKYYLKRGEKFYAPILDPVGDDLAEHGRVVRLALEPLPISCVNEPLRVDADAHLANHAWPALAIPNEVETSLGDIERIVSAIWPDSPFNRQRIYSRLNRLRRRRDFFFDMYQRLQPEFIVLSSFTGWLHALWAAKDLGIPVIDVQHGGQGETHFPTTHFTKVPEAGYHFLPDVLWLWGKTNRDFATPWLPGGARHRHLPVIGGHRAVAQWDRNRRLGKLVRTDTAFIDRFSGRSNVLVTLSYAIDPLMPEAVFEAIRRTPDLHWLIRLHPIHRPKAARDQLLSRLGELGISNVSIDEPTDVQLQTALFVSRAHLTPFSTSVREAIALGVPSAVVHPVAEPLFKEELETGQIELAISADEIIEFVRRHERSSATAGLRTDAIEVSDAAVRDVVDAAREVREKALPLKSTIPDPTMPSEASRHQPRPQRAAPQGRIASLLRRFRHR
jgi:hypothetical protein